jgi:hypothetical protein
MTSEEERRHQERIKNFRFYKETKEFHEKVSALPEVTKFANKHGYADGKKTIYWGQEEPCFEHIKNWASDEYTGKWY